MQQAALCMQPACASAVPSVLRASHSQHRLYPSSSHHPSASSQLHHRQAALVTAILHNGAPVLAVAVLAEWRVSGDLACGVGGLDKPAHQGTNRGGGGGNGGGIGVAAGLGCRGREGARAAGNWAAGASCACGWLHSPAQLAHMPQPSLSLRSPYVRSLPIPPTRHCNGCLVTVVGHIHQVHRGQGALLLQHSGADRYVRAAGGAGDGGARGAAREEESGSNRHRAQVRTHISAQPA